MAARKSRWIAIPADTERQLAHLRSWFDGLIDGSRIVKAEVLHHLPTDRLKRIRVKCIEADGSGSVVTRTFGRRQYSISFEGTGVHNAA